MNAGYWRTVVGWWSSRGSIHGSKELRNVGPLRLSANRQWSTGDRHVAIGPGAACPLRRTQLAKAATAFGRLLDCYRPKQVIETPITASTKQTLAWHQP